MFLGVVSVWAIVNMYQDERVKMAEMHTQMKPTYTYFDYNRAALPIWMLTPQSSTASCPADYKRATLMNWSGNNKGYVTQQNEFKTGDIPTGTVGATLINAHPATSPYIFN